MNTARFLQNLILLPVIILLAAACGTSDEAYRYGGVELTDTPVNFTLADTTLGRPVQLSDFENDITLIYFGYTFCPDVCPLTLWEMKQALKTVPAADRSRIHVLFISADPQRDTPEALARYVSAFGPEFIGLTDTEETVQSVMRAYGAFAKKEAVSESGFNYLVSHTATTFLVGPKGSPLLQYPFGFTATDLSRDLRHLLAQPVQQSAAAGRLGVNNNF
ncbi:MAG: SCO family protein [Chloroflexi bacterium]|nr:MAG: SCO family protein [Chloroflexota bacterium]